MAEDKWGKIPSIGDYYPDRCCEMTEDKKPLHVRWYDMSADEIDKEVADLEKRLAGVEEDVIGMRELWLDAAHRVNENFVIVKRLEKENADLRARLQQAEALTAEYDSRLTTYNGEVLWPPDHGD